MWVKYLVHLPLWIETFSTNKVTTSTSHFTSAFHMSNTFGKIFHFCFLGISSASFSEFQIAAPRQLIARSDAAGDNQQIQVQDALVAILRCHHPMAGNGCLFFTSRFSLVENMPWGNQKWARMWLFWYVLNEILETLGETQWTMGQTQNRVMVASNSKDCLGSQHKPYRWPNKNWHTQWCWETLVNHEMGDLRIQYGDIYQNYGMKPSRTYNYCKLAATTYGWNIFLRRQHQALWQLWHDMRRRALTYLMPSTLERWYLRCRSSGASKHEIRSLILTSEEKTTRTQIPQIPYLSEALHCCPTRFRRSARSHGPHSRATPPFRDGKTDKKWPRY